MLGQINWHPEKKEVRQSGLGMLVGAAVIGAVMGLAGKMGWPLVHKIFGSIAAAGFLMVLLPGIFKFFYYIWMSVAFVLGSIISPIILGLFFYVFITPFSIILRIVRRSPLNLKMEDKESFWEEPGQEITPERFERQS